MKYIQTAQIFVCVCFACMFCPYTHREARPSFHSRPCTINLPVLLLYSFIRIPKNINYSSRNQLHQRPQFSLLRYSEILALWANTSLRDDHSTGNSGSYLGKLLCKCSLKSSLTSELLRNSSTGRADHNHLVLLGCYCYASPQR